MVTALAPGECVVCAGTYHAGDDVGLVVEGWAHLDCFDHVTGDHR